MAERVLLMVGTRKGAFLCTSDKDRRRWKVSGPHFAGTPVYHLTCDTRGGDAAIYAAVNSVFFGPSIEVSRDLGKTWKPLSAPKYPKGSGRKVQRLWHLEPGLPSQSDVLYAGVEPAGLFVSSDSGKTWREVAALNNHPSRPKWEPGAGGLCLHTIVLDPSNIKRMWVAISAAGVFRTTDGGKTWTPANKGTRADFLPGKYPKVGQCVHKVAMHPSRPSVLYQQNHCGVYRSDNGADSWTEMPNGLPATFGFPVAVHTKHPDTAYLVPMEGADNRVPVGGRFAVYRSTNGGKSWQESRKGLPARAYFTVLREGLCVDAFDPAGVYVGAEAGTIFASRDNGDTWYALTRSLPPVLSVSCALL